MADSNGTGSRWLAALIAFGVVGGGIYVTGLLATTLLRYVILPIAAVFLGVLAARVVFRMSGKS